jgi:hypothetical protein
MTIRCKAEFYQLWEAGCLGNRTQIFHTLEDAIRGTPSGMVGFREIGKTGGGRWDRSANHDEARQLYFEWCMEGRRFIMDDGVPNWRSTMQGEINRGIEGLYGYIAVGYGLPPMRLSMAQGLHRHYYRVQVRVLMQHYMDPASQDDVDALLDLYPEATIEFACFDVGVGHILGRNTIFWETRNY